ncbi:MAG: hypothetical protein A2086_00650 [Spirochaetes bacterium GWD1_27_9]|nr:MAG: hypothetical protein A2Z98_05160 [Spirochaetes bacterium GWB1_27_13]OHD21719.1 MAG: hypothetical protein A2Y34_08450 [Spirochaetes bacterium GWC1_27_15]OHD32519.1 MAG: hypothetical protein A2086_00650 [Spirochaetes bacterium GWD1_27_9]
MNILYFLDEDNKSKLSDDLKLKINNLANNKGHKIEIIEVSKNDVLPCSGCLNCIMKGTGECCIKDLMFEINKRIIDIDIIFYITPIIFGQYSSTIKNITDKCMTVKMKNIPTFIAIGYGEDLNNDECQTFIDITKKHKGDANTLHPLIKEKFEVFITKSIDDNKLICEKINKLI